MLWFFSYGSDIGYVGNDDSVDCDECDHAIGGEKACANLPRPRIHYAYSMFQRKVNL